MMDDEQHTQPADNTYPVPYENPYYQELPPPPPPDRSRRHQRTLFLLWGIILGLCFLLLGSFALVAFTLSNRPSHNLSDAQVTTRLATTSTPIPSPNPTQSPTPIPSPTLDTSYTATDILNDFINAGCICGEHPLYGETIWWYSNGNYYVSVHASSSAIWADPPQTSGAAEVGLWVYPTVDDASAAYSQVGNDELNPNPQATPIPEYLVPTEYVHGRCLLLISGYSSTPAPWSGYQRALEQDCV